MEGAFRKIDIDAYDEDVLQESELYDADPRDPAEVLDEAKQRQVAVRTSLAKWVINLWKITHANAPPKFQKRHCWRAINSFRKRAIWTER
jgi:hypothetical protein